jgi:hypothetical protein
MTLNVYLSIPSIMEFLNSALNNQAQNHFNYFDYLKPQFYNWSDFLTSNDRNHLKEGKKGRWI